MLDFLGHCKITDFGLCKQLDDPHGKTDTFCGTFVRKIIKVNFSTQKRKNTKIDFCFLSHFKLKVSLFSILKFVISVSFYYRKRFV
jgi:serine/threonine protein kinase